MPTDSFQLESDHSVQRIGGDYTQFDGRSFTAVEVQKYAFHKLRQSNTKLSEDDDLCVIAALDPEYPFPNQTARRHIYSVWNHKLNPEFADKEKPRGLYQGQNKPTWFPKDVRYLSATNGRFRLEFDQTILLVKENPNTKFPILNVNFLNARKGEPKLSAEELSRVLPIIRDNLVEFLKQEMLQIDLSRVPELPNDVVENLRNQVGKPNSSLGKTQVFKIEPEFTTSDASVTLCVNFGESKPTFDGFMYVDVVEPIADQGHALQYTATLQMPHNSTNSSAMQETYVDPSPLGPIPTVVESMEPEEAAMEESIPAETKLDSIPALTSKEISDLSCKDVDDILANQFPGIFQVRPVLDKPVLKDEKPLTVMLSGNPTMKIEKPPSANNLYIEGVDDWWASPVARDKYTPSFCSAPTVDDGAFPVLPHTNEVLLIIEPHQVSDLDEYFEIGDIVEILQDVDFNAMDDLLAGDDPISMIIDEMDEPDRRSSL